MELLKNNSYLDEFEAPLIRPVPEITPIFDDEIDTAGSMMETVRVLKEFGAKAIYAGCTHGVLSGPAIERIQNSPIKELVITNTIPLQKEKQIPQIKVVSIAPLFAETIKRLNERKPLGELLKRK